MKTNDNGTEREMNETELAAYEALQADYLAISEAENDARTERAAARQAVLDKLGLTADEAAALLG